MHDRQLCAVAGVPACDAALTVQGAGDPDIDEYRDPDADAEWADADTDADPDATRPTFGYPLADPNWPRCDSDRYADPDRIGDGIADAFGHGYYPDRALADSYCSAGPHAYPDCNCY